MIDMARILAEPIGNEASYVSVYRFVCRFCGGEYLAPGSQPVNVPHQRQGLCFHCYQAVQLGASLQASAAGRW